MKPGPKKRTDEENDEIDELRFSISLKRLERTTRKFLKLLLEEKLRYFNRNFG